MQATEELRYTEEREKSKKKGFWTAIISAVSFSTLGIFAKFLYAEGFSVLSALAWRFIVAAVFLWLILLLHAQRDRKTDNRGSNATSSLKPHRTLKNALRPRAKFLSIFMLGLLGFCPQAGLFFVTVNIIDPGIASLLLYLYPSFVFLIAFILSHQKASALQAMATSSFHLRGVSSPFGEQEIIHWVVSCWA